MNVMRKLHKAELRLICAIKCAVKINQGTMKLEEKNIFSIQNIFMYVFTIFFYNRGQRNTERRNLNV